MPRRLPALLALLAFACAAHAAAPTAPALSWEPLCEPGSGGALVACAVSPHDSKRILLAGDMLGLGLSTDGADSWQATFGLSTWEMAGITWHPRDPQTVWAGSMSGPWLSRDGGKNWTSKRHGFPPLAHFGRAAPVESILFDPRDEKRLLAPGGSSRRWEDPGKKALWGALWESTDAGESWRKLTTITRDGSSSAPDAKGVNFFFAAFSADGETLLGLADGAGLLVSADRGRTWARRPPAGLPAGARITKIALHPRQARTLWLATADRKDASGKHVPGSVYRSTDAGETCRETARGLDARNQERDNRVTRFDGLAVSPSDPRVLYVSDTAWNSGIVYRSDDGGENWRPVASRGHGGVPSGSRPATAYPAGIEMTGAAFDPRSADVAYFFNTEFVLRTRNAGKTFDDATSILVTRSARDPGWRGRGFSGLCAMNFRFNPYQQGQSIAQGMDAARCWLSNDNLRSWHYRLIEPDPWSGGQDAAFTRNGHIYLSTGQYGFWGIARSADGGRKFTLLHGAARGLPELRQGGGKASAGILALPHDHTRAWAVVEGKLFATRDAGETWKPLTLGTGEPARFALDPRNDKRFFVSTSAAVYLTTDAGDTFAPIGGPRNAGRMTVDSRGRLYLAAFEAARPGVWRYDGAAWTRLLDETLAADIAVDPANPDRLALATNMNPYADICRATGVWISSDAGQSWSQANDGLAMTRGVCIAFDPFDSETLVFGTMGRGFFKARWPKAAAPAGTRRYAHTPADATFAATRPAHDTPR